MLKKGGSHDASSAFCRGRRWPIGRCLQLFEHDDHCAAVPGPYRSGAEQACLYYGFQPGTDPYNRCVVREAQSRALGRAPADYADRIDRNGNIISPQSTRP